MTRTENIQRIADNLHKEISGSVLEALIDNSNHPSDVMVAFLAILPEMIGKAFVAIDDKNRKKALHELLFNMVQEIDSSSKSYEEFKDAQGE